MMARASYYNVTMTDQEISGIEWLSQHKYDGAQVYGDYISRDRVAIYGLMDIEDVHIVQLGGKLDEGTYVYLRSFNVDEQLLALERPRRILKAATWMLLYDIDTILPELEEDSLVYSNGGSEIYYVGYK